jgi:hypothetical protein
MKRIAVIGIGTGGIQALCHFCSYLDRNWQIVSIHDPSVPIVGIGESTNPSFITAIELGLDYHVHGGVTDSKMDETLKLGTKYINWREKDFLIPLIIQGVAVHFNTFKLKEYAFPLLKKKWNNKFQTLEGKVTKIENLNDSAKVTIDDEDHYFDYVMDCRGFPKSYDEHIVVDNPTNHALVHNIPVNEKQETWYHTKHVATKDGWMFGVPLKTRHSYGYLFNDNVTSTEEAKRNFSEEIGVPEDQLQGIEFKYKSYYAKKSADGRVIKNGNSAVFFEPMFANSLWLYDGVNRFTIDLINGEIDEGEFNKRFHLRARAVHELLQFVYHGGSIYDTPFWQKTVVEAGKKLQTSEFFAKTISLMQMNNEKGGYFYEGGPHSWVFSLKSLHQLEEGLGYNYFAKFTY